ncbi:MAG: hypothetical protein ABL983_03200 [Nitrospira sp.]
MTNTFQKTYFVIRLCNDSFSSDDQHELPIHHSHQLVRRVEEIIPYSIGRINEDVEGVAHVSAANVLDKLNQKQEINDGARSYGLRGAAWSASEGRSGCCRDRNIRFPVE